MRTRPASVAKDVPRCSRGRRADPASGLAVVAAAGQRRAAATGSFLGLAGDRRSAAVGLSAVHAVCVLAR